MIGLESLKIPMVRMFECKQTKLGMYGSKGLVFRNEYGINCAVSVN
ncbi:MAG: hypothetical protein ACLTT7_06990 [Paraclostridium bifermentans]